MTIKNKNGIIKINIIWNKIFKHENHILLGADLKSYELKDINIDSNKSQLIYQTNNEPTNDYCLFLFCDNKIHNNCELNLNEEEEISAYSCVMSQLY